MKVRIRVDVEERLKTLEAVVENALKRKPQRNFAANEKLITTAIKLAKETRVDNGKINDRLTAIEVKQATTWKTRLRDFFKGDIVREKCCDDPNHGRI